VVAPSSTSFTRGLESNRTATGILIFSDLTGYTSQRLSGHAASTAEPGCIYHMEEASEPPSELAGRLSCINQHPVPS
jgi:hypothetical protein